MERNGKRVPTPPRIMLRGLAYCYASSLEMIVIRHGITIMSLEIRMDTSLDMLTYSSNMIKSVGMIIPDRNGTTEEQENAIE